MQALTDENLGLYHDRWATDPVDDLEFRVPNIPGVLRESRPELVYIVNHSLLRLALVEPCRAVICEGRRVGFINADVVGLGGQPRGNVCDRPDVQLALGEMVQAWVALYGIDPNRSVADHPFVAVFGAVGVSPIPPPAGMVSWWPGDGNSQDIVDGNHGTLQGDATYAPGLVKEAFSLDGDGDYVHNSARYI